MNLALTGLFDQTCQSNKPVKVCSRADLPISGGASEDAVPAGRSIAIDLTLPWFGIQDSGFQDSGFRV